MKLRQRLLLASVCLVIICFFRYHQNYNIINESETVEGNDIRRSLDVGNEIERNYSTMDPWDIWNEMPTLEYKRTITSSSDLNVNIILNAMLQYKITRADKGVKGTQLKSQLTLSESSSQKVVFKTKRYARDKILPADPPYVGFDRHNGEIAAFHLDRLFHFFRAPPVVGRVVNMEKEFIPVANGRLLDTFWKDNDDNICFYGVCRYCKKSDSACGVGVNMESSLTIWLPQKWQLKKMRHPWQRTYIKNKKALWEKDPDYCARVRNVSPYKTGPRLLDLIDAAIFDFLIQNADRHHYEYIEDANTSLVLNLDNGKSFGNPYHDELSILAPLEQCCILRISTFKTIKSLLLDASNGILLSVKLEEKLKTDSIYPILTDDHLKALDRRLIIVSNYITKCIESKKKINVLL